MIYFHQIERPNPYAAATHRFERKIIETDFRRFWDLRDIMTALPHIQFKDGYTLDAYYVGDRRNARMKLYAYLMDSTEDYNPGPVGVHQNPDNMLKGISILSISETPGLGMNAENVLVPQFRNKKLEEYKVVKTGAASSDEIDAITSATITSNAVTNGVNTGVRYYTILSEGGEN